MRIRGSRGRFLSGKINPGFVPLLGKHGTVAAPAPPPDPVLPVTSGLTLWLKADAGVLKAGGAAAADLDPIETWQDQSGSLNHLTQATLARQPTFRTNIKNGKPVVRCVDDSLSKVTPAQATQAYSLFLVLKSDVLTGAQAAIFNGNPSGDGYGFIHDLATTYRRQLLHGGVAFIADGAATVLWHQVSVVQAANVAMWIDGVSETLAASGLPLAPTAAITVANYSNTHTSYWQGDLAEILLYNRTLTDAERISVQDYLKTRWGL